MLETLPKDFINNMKKILSEQDFSSFLRSFEETPKRAFRVNLNKISSTNWEKLKTFKQEPIPALKNAFYLKEDVKMGGQLCHQSGLIYMQEPAAMMVVESLPNIEGKVVLDMCAAPGGKSFQLSQKVGDNGLVISNEYVSKRINILRGNIERLGCKNVAITNNDSKALSKNLKENCFVVLVDAPCSGEGMFRKNPSTISEWSLDNVELCAKRQHDILDNAKDCVCDGGYLLYSTCTYNTKENEQTIVNFLKENPEFSLKDIPKNIKDISSNGLILDNDFPTNKCRRFYTFSGVGEGQFLALMQKTGIFKEDTGRFKIPQPRPSEQKAIQNFLSSFLKEYSFEIGKIGNTFFALPNKQTDLKDLAIVTCGIAIGTIEGNRLIPHHNICAFGENIKNIINYCECSQEISKYLHGEQLQSQEASNGWCAISYDNHILGLGKASNGKINNHYPKGLRNF